MSDVEVIQVIHTRLERRGMGKDEGDPVRIIDQYWRMDGTLLLEYDVFLGTAGSSVHEIREKR